LECYEYVKRIAKELNLESSDEKSVLKFLLDKSVKELYEIQNKIKDVFLIETVKSIN
jgi:hypothetical protein